MAGARSPDDGRIPEGTCGGVSSPAVPGLRRITVESINNKTGMTYAEVREFIRNHFEEFVNKKNVSVGWVNFAADFVDHGADVPPGMPPGPAGAIEYVSGALKAFPDLRVEIQDLVAEDDKVVVRNRWS